MNHLIIIAAACLALAGAARAETTWDATGPQGGSVTGSGRCAAGGGSLTCTRASTLSGPRGHVLGHSGTRVSDGTGTTKTFLTTGPKGHGVTSTRSRSRRN